MQLVVNGDMNAASITGSEVPLRDIDILSIQAVWTGTPTGNLKLQATIDDVTWTDLSGTTVATGGVAGDVIWNVTNMAYKKIRPVYTKTSSTGVLNIVAANKEFQ